MSAKRKPPADQAAPTEDRQQAMWVPIDSVRHDPANVREHTPRNMETLRALLREFGQQKPIVVDQDGVILAGNGTWDAAKALGWSEIWVSVSKLTGDRARAYAIGDNRSTDLSQFDEVLLAEQAANLAPDLLSTIGFDSAEIEAMLPRLAELPGEAEATKDGRAAVAAAIKKRVLLRLMLACDNIEVIERALQHTGQANREQAMTRICREWLDAQGQLDIR